MDITTSNQLYVFFFCALCGAGIAFLFDIFRIFRRVVSTGKCVTFIQDITYWIISALLFFFAVLLTNDGELRFFELAAVFAGSCLYFVTVSRFVIAASVKIIEVTLKILYSILKILTAPIRWVARLLKKPVFIVLGNGKRTFRKIKYRFKKNWEMCKKFVTKI